MALGFIGITRIHQIAIEGQETGGGLLAASVAGAQQQVDVLVAEIQAALEPDPQLFVTQHATGAARAQVS